MAGRQLGHGLTPSASPAPPRYQEPHNGHSDHISTSYSISASSAKWWGGASYRVEHPDFKIPPPTSNTALAERAVPSLAQTRLWQGQYDLPRQQGVASRSQKDTSLSSGGRDSHNGVAQHPDSERWLPKALVQVPLPGADRSSTSAQSLRPALQRLKLLQATRRGIRSQENDSNTQNIGDPPINHVLATGRPTITPVDAPSLGLKDSAVYFGPPESQSGARDAQFSHKDASEPSQSHVATRDWRALSPSRLPRLHGGRERLSAPREWADEAGTPPAATPTVRFDRSKRFGSSRVPTSSTNKPPRAAQSPPPSNDGAHVVRRRLPSSPDDPRSTGGSHIAHSIDPRRSTQRRTWGDAPDAASSRWDDAEQPSSSSTAQACDRQSWTAVGGGRQHVVRARASAQKDLAVQLHSSCQARATVQADLSEAAQLLGKMDMTGPVRKLPGSFRGLVDDHDERMVGSMGGQGDRQGQDGVAEHEGGSAAGIVQLQRCGTCSRRFAPEALARHAPICRKAAMKQQRPKYDSVAARKVAQPEDPNAAPSVAAAAASARVGVGRSGRIAHRAPKGHVRERGRDGRQQEERAISSKYVAMPKWKRESLAFRQAMQATRPGGKRQGVGLDLGGLGAVAQAEVDDRVQCPTCNRKFAPLTAERHIPVCASRAKRGRSESEL